MITDLILTIFYGFIYVVTLPLRAFADVNFPPELDNAITTANNYITSMDLILPVGTLLTILGLVLSIELVVLLYKIIKWVYVKIPGIN